MLNPIRNFLHQRRIDKFHKEVAASPQWKNFLDQGLDGLVRLIEPGSKRNFLEQNHASYYELEHRYGVHIWIYAAINAIAEKSAVPKLVIKNDDGEIMDSTRLPMLPMQPNKMQTWDELEQLTAIHLELTGNAYIYHDRDTDEFLPLRPSRVRIVPDEGNNGILGYGYRQTNSNENLTYVRARRQGKAAWMYDDPDLLKWDKATYTKRWNAYHGYVEKGKVELQGIPDNEIDDWVPFNVEDVLHFKYPSPTNDFYGLPPIYPLLTSLNTELYARQWNKRFFENGAIPPGVLIIPKVLPDKVFEQIKDRFVKQYTGTGNRGKPLVLQGGEIGADYKAFPGQHRDLEFLDGLNHTRDEILGVLGVPPEILGMSMGGTHASGLSPGMKEKRSIFWQDTIMPKQKMKAARWTQHFEDQLPDGFSYAYDYEEIEDLRPNYGERAKASINGMRGGMTIPEVRENILGLPAEWEGAIFVPTNLVPITYAQYTAGTIAPAETPEAIEPPADDASEPEPIPDQIKEAAD